MQWKTDLGKSHLEISPVSLLKNFPFKNLSQEMTTVSPAFPFRKINAKNGRCVPSFRFLERGGAKQSDLRGRGQDKLG